MISYKEIISYIGWFSRSKVFRRSLHTRYEDVSTMNFAIFVNHSLSTSTRWSRIFWDD